MMLLSCLAWTGDVDLLHGGLCDCGRAPRPITAALASPDILPPQRDDFTFLPTLYYSGQLSSADSSRWLAGCNICECLGPIASGILSRKSPIRLPKKTSILTDGVQGQSDSTLACQNLRYRIFTEYNGDVCPSFLHGYLRNSVTAL